MRNGRHATITAAIIMLHIIVWSADSIISSCRSAEISCYAQLLPGNVRLSEHQTLLAAVSCSCQGNTSWKSPE